MIPAANVQIEDFYPYSYTPRPRYGEGSPGHSSIERILAKGLRKYEAALESYTEFLPELAQIGRTQDQTNTQMPFWDNVFFSGLDAAVLYGMLAKRKPKTYCEIGSGNSTRFAGLSRSRHSPWTQFVSVDPAPRAEVERLCQTVVRAPLQACNPEFFSTLGEGDVLFIDGSHRVLQNSDVSVLFLEILPIIAPGVIIHLHDTFWPSDYPSVWTRRMYSEQYMLGLLLLFAEDKFEVLMPNAYIGTQSQLYSIFDDLWKAPNLRGIPPACGSFWFTKR